MRLPEVRPPTAAEILHAMGIVIRREVMKRGGRVHIPTTQLAPLLLHKITAVGLGEELCFTSQPLQGKPLTYARGQERRIHQAMAWLLRQAPKYTLRITQSELMGLLGFVLEENENGLSIRTGEIPVAEAGKTVILQPNGQAVL